MHFTPELVYSWSVETSTAPTLTIEVLAGQGSDVKIIQLNGPLVITNFFEFQEIIRQKPLPRVLLIDLSAVPYMDSAALGSLVGLHVSCETHNRKYAIVGASDRLKTLFDVTQVRQLLVSYDSIAEAESKLGSGGGR